MSLKLFGQVIVGWLSRTETAGYITACSLRGTSRCLSPLSSLTAADAVAPVSSNSSDKEVYPEITVTLVAVCETTPGGLKLCQETVCPVSERRHNCASSYPKMNVCG